MQAKAALEVHTSLVNPTSNPSAVYTLPAHLHHTILHPCSLPSLYTHTPHWFAHTQPHSQALMHPSGSTPGCQACGKPQPGLGPTDAKGSTRLGWVPGGAGGHPHLCHLADPTAARSVSVIPMNFPVPCNRSYGNCGGDPVTKATGVPRQPLPSQKGGCQGLRASDGHRQHLQVMPIRTSLLCWGMPMGAGEA